MSPVRFLPPHPLTLSSPPLFKRNWYELRNWSIGQVVGTQWSLSTMSIYNFQIYNYTYNGHVVRFLKDPSAKLSRAGYGIAILKLGNTKELLSTNINSKKEKKKVNEKQRFNWCRTTLEGALGQRNMDHGVMSIAGHEGLEVLTKGHKWVLQKWELNLVLDLNFWVTVKTTF